MLRTTRPFLLFFTAVILAGISRSGAQVSTRDSLALSMFYPSYSINLPFADLKDRFGITHTAGAGYTFMGHNRWLFSAEGNFIFGPDVKNLASLLEGIMTGDGHVISEEGTFANLAITERGYSVLLKAGKLIPLSAANPNTGLVLMAGTGFLQHKIRIDVSQNNAPQLRKEYKKGYDKMCNGPVVSEFVGYQYLDPGKRINFYCGFEFLQAWTYSRRSYYFAEKMRPNEKRFDLMAGIKIGWLVPLYRKTGREFYYY